jgi:hypothetical protein
MGARPSPKQSRLITLITAVGVVAVMGGGAMLATNVADVSAAATTALHLSSTAPGVTCDNSNPSMPVCSGLAGGDLVTLAGTGFTPGSLASDIQCNSDPHQPVILFLGNYIPISCTPLKISNISPSGAYNPPPFAVVQGTPGPVINNPSIYPPGCTIDPTKGKPPLPGQSGPIPGCTTSGNPVTDAANFPCPPTAAQQAAGDDCAIAIGDQAGDRGVGVVLFGTETLPTSTTTTTSGTTTTSPTSTLTRTQPSASTVTLGPSGSVGDTVTVKGTPAHGSPSGNVNFYVCQTGTGRTLATGPCPATAADHLSTVHLTPGANNSASAPSGSIIPSSAGTWCFSAVYGGDSVYTGSADNTSASNLDPNECVLVAPAVSTIATFISSANVTLGPSGTASDFVTVSGNVVGGSPTGSVSFYACHTSAAATLVPGPCPAAGTPVDAAAALVLGAGASSSVTSTAFAPTSVGTWCFSAVYGGNATYAASADNTSASNLDPNECVLVGVPAGDAITSDPNASGSVGTAFLFLVTTSGTPTPVIKKKGKLPRGLHFVNNQNGTATLSGVPTAKSIGVHHLTIQATFGKGKSKVVVTQAFTVTVS